MIRVKTIPLAIIIVATILGGVELTRATGYWRTTSSKQPATFSTGELSGMPNPADIRGSYTWRDIEKAFGVPAFETASAFSPSGTPLDVDVRVSVLEDLYAALVPEGYEIGTGAVRAFVSLYTGLPMDIEEGTILPEAAINLLADRPGVDQATLSSMVWPGLDATSVVESMPKPMSEATPANTNEPASSSGSGTGTGSGTGSREDRVVVGRTTFGDLYSWGLTESQVEEICGFSPGPRVQTVREAAEAAGVSFSSFKDSLQELIDN